MVKRTIEKLLQDGVNIIKKREYNNPFLDVQLILSYLLNKDKIYLILNKDEEVEDNIVGKFYEMIEKRNLGYPLQYMINSQEFMGLEFFVQEGVLVPRPDTETLVEKVINYVKNSNLNNENIKILDIGTGSGAIAISLGYYLKNSHVTAIDISDVAIETAKINVGKLNLNNVNIEKIDIFNFNGTEIIDDKYDIVVSNPPYIESDEISYLPTEVSQYEPKLALDGGKDGLEYYRQIVKIFKEIHESNSMLSVEIGYNQKRAVTEIFEKSNIFQKIEWDKDLSGIYRVVSGFL
ncbi:MAG: peptide chain release factor N(5)-glutamine methyltransferase [Tissierellia bacterium]|nr:peptide chain release factor N(5)-glutamine methyltransferase [Tissierellia bacterium]MDD4780113.1 peptide chain release factor N(5)-glutamine methyltransferase [Tissierellia bacterium]